MTPEQQYQLMNQTQVGWHVVALAVPTRILRIVRDTLAITFRVEQLDTSTGNWRAISTHVDSDKVAWDSLGFAMQDLCTAQTRLKEKIKLAQHEARMAQIKAENPLGA